MATTGQICTCAGQNVLCQIGLEGSKPPCSSNSVHHNRAQRAGRRAARDLFPSSSAWQSNDAHRFSSVPSFVPCSHVCGTFPPPVRRAALRQRREPTADEIFSILRHLSEKLGPLVATHQRAADPGRRIKPLILIPIFAANSLIPSVTKSSASGPASWDLNASPRFRRMAVVGAGVLLC